MWGLWRSWLNMNLWRCLFECDNFVSLDSKLFFSIWPFIVVGKGISVLDSFCDSIFWLIFSALKFFDFSVMWDIRMHARLCTVVTFAEAKNLFILVISCSLLSFYFPGVFVGDWVKSLFSGTVNWDTFSIVFAGFLSAFVCVVFLFNFLPWFSQIFCARFCIFYTKKKQIPNNRYFWDHRREILKTKIRVDWFKIELQPLVAKKLKELLDYAVIEVMDAVSFAIKSSIMKLKSQSHSNLVFYWSLYALSSSTKVFHFLSTEHSFFDHEAPKGLISQLNGWVYKKNL